MDLWIRSQDREILTKTRYIEYREWNKEHKICINGDVFGKYKSKERALEVLDEIQNKVHQTFICELKPLVTKDDCERIKSDLEGEYPNNEFIMQPPHYELKPINSNVVIYKMPKE